MLLAPASFPPYRRPEPMLLLACRPLGDQRGRRRDVPRTARPFRGPDAHPQAHPVRPHAQALRGAREAHRRGQAPGPQDRREVRVRARRSTRPRWPRPARPASADRDKIRAEAVKREQEILATVRAVHARRCSRTASARHSAEAERARAHAEGRGRRRWRATSPAACSGARCSREARARRPRRRSPSWCS